MKFKLFISCLIISLSSGYISAQIDARMFQFPDVSEKHITFNYAGDIWIVSKEGGLASKISSPVGQESFPKFSSDGNHIAYTANYNGNNEVYTIPVTGGTPNRLTYHGSNDRVIDWWPNDEKILFASGRYSERQRYNQFYTVDVEGGLASKLPIAYGEFAGINADGKHIAYTPTSRAFRLWKRYRGGTNADIYIFNLEDLSSYKIDDNSSNDEIPMWYKDDVYFLSDRGVNKRNNIWKYEAATKNLKQITSFKDYDIHFPSIGGSDIVFEAGGELYLLNVISEKYKKVNIQVVSDNYLNIAKIKNVSDYISSLTPSPKGNRVVVEARGELFSLPAEKGTIKNLSQSSGSAERYPEWSPNGKQIAYWSDKTGEYQLYIRNTEDGKVSKITDFSDGFNYSIYWSPDSKKLCYINNSMSIMMIDIESKDVSKIDKAKWKFEGGLQNFSVDWSKDSKWITYSRGLGSRLEAIFLYNVDNKKLHQVTSGYYSDSDPVFDPEGKYLYFFTARNFSPNYSDLDNSFIYPNATQVAVVSLRNDVPSILAPENDKFEVIEEKKNKDDKKDKDEKDKEKKDEKSEDESLVIDLEGFESRVEVLDLPAGNYTGLMALEGKLVYLKFSNTGAANRSRSLKLYNLKDKEEKEIISGINFYSLTADKKKLLVGKGNKYGFIGVKPKQKLDKTIPSKDIEMSVNPKQEWKQIFTEVWRLERDYFYDKNMHGVDWNEMKTRYGSLVENAVTRWDVNYIIGELIGELNASHTYRGGGDSPSASRKSVGYLGVNWGVKDGHYVINDIIKAADWDSEVRSPFALSGVDVEEGDYVLEVNGIPMSINESPYKYFQGLSRKTVELKIGKTTSIKDAKSVIVKTLRSESRLRHLAWIEQNRALVDKESNGDLGYIYVRSTGVDGQNELVRQFHAQFNKKGLIIDERFNSGGQIPDRFIELLDRKPLAYWAVRDGQTWQWPPQANFGPKVMLINGFSGSGGDAFPDYFKKTNLGPLVGTRTWGGLIGISGAPTLIDGGYVTLPTFRMYDPDGKWFKEGHGVDPDYLVEDDPTIRAKGQDPQLNKAIDVAKELLKDAKKAVPDHDDYETR